MYSRFPFELLIVNTAKCLPFPSSRLSTLLKVTFCICLRFSSSLLRECRALHCCQDGHFSDDICYQSFGLLSAFFPFVPISKEREKIPFRFDYVSCVFFFRSHFRNIHFAVEFCCSFCLRALFSMHRHSLLLTLIAFFPARIRCVFLLAALSLHNAIVLSKYLAIFISLSLSLSRSLSVFRCSVSLSASK